jgi:arginyl-tRNA synthetase
MLRKLTIFFAATKIDLSNDNDEIADILGISAVIINDLKQRRHRDYIFDWGKALQVSTHFVS